MSHVCDNTPGIIIYYNKTEMSNGKVETNSDVVFYIHAFSDFQL